MLDAKAQAIWLWLTMSMDTWKVEATILFNSHVSWGLYNHSSGCNKIISSYIGLLATD